MGKEWTKARIKKYLEWLLILLNVGAITCACVVIGLTCQLLDLDHVFLLIDKSPSAVIVLLISSSSSILVLALGNMGLAKTRIKAFHIAVSLFIYREK